MLLCSGLLVEVEDASYLSKDGKPVSKKDLHVKTAKGIEIIQLSAETERDLPLELRDMLKLNEDGGWLTPELLGTPVEAACGTVHMRLEKVCIDAVEVLQLRLGEPPAPASKSNGRATASTGS